MLHTLRFCGVRGVGVGVARVHWAPTDGRSANLGRPGRSAARHGPLCCLRHVAVAVPGVEPGALQAGPHARCECTRGGAVVRVRGTLQATSCTGVAHARMRRTCVYEVVILFGCVPSRTRREGAPQGRTRPRDKGQSRLSTAERRRRGLEDVRLQSRGGTVAPAGGFGVHRPAPRTLVKAVGERGLCLGWGEEWYEYRG